MQPATTAKPITFETHPAQYRHWRLDFDGPLATLSMDVAEDAALVPDYKLKLNSYDLGVDIELADALTRIRFEHPETRALVLTSLKDRIFCAGANIFMLGGSSHAFKVNFCKFTNETRLALEDMSEHSGIRSLAAVNGICAGGGYELALACDEIALVDDGNSAVSLPETPLLGVLPGTGGLTRVVDKRKVRRDRADVFSTLVEGIKGRRAVEWGLVDAVHPTSQFKDKVRARALELANLSKRSGIEPGLSVLPLTPRISDDEIAYRHVDLKLQRARRTAELTLRAPDADPPATAADILRAGGEFWLLRVFRELDDALLWLRFNEPEIGTIVLRTEGDPALVLAADRAVAEHGDVWYIREIRHFVKRVLKRLDLTARSFFAFIEPGSCFAGSLLELALAADRVYMLNDPDRPTAIQLSPLNAGLLPMSNGLSRLQVRFLGEPSRVGEVLAHKGAFGADEALETGLVTSAPDDLDWEDEVRLAVEERAALSPDALTGMEANLRFAGPETLETKIFSRLSAWQNWIFQRPNAVGERGALRVYGREGRPEFDWRRT
ncbi:MAG: benzoyl-CoA-dihydrodiol lyase [Acidobacteria bacterium]|nr:benzoyl-CoA-dihydrodiol lyase [Acidobacteriota bacterium]